MKRIALIMALLSALLSSGAVALGAVGDGFNPPVKFNYLPVLAVQPWDGKLIVGGVALLDSNGQDTCLLRLNADGSIDTSFVANIPHSWVNAVAFLPDHGMIVVGNFDTVNGVTRRRIARLDENGRLDSFDPEISAAGPALEVKTVALLPDGKSIVVGEGIPLSGSPTVQYLAKIFMDPENPATYGKLDTSYPTVDGVVYSVKVQDDHKVLVGGHFETVTWPSGSVSRSNLVRLNADGTVDGTFTPIPDDRITDIELQPDGEILLAGYFFGITAGGTYHSRNSVARLTRNGEVQPFDPQIGLDGLALTMALQPDGSLVLGGEFTTVQGLPRKNVARVSHDGTVDSFNPGNDYKVIGIGVQQDGKILLGSWTDGTVLPVPRYYPYGTRDTAVASTAVLPDGRVSSIALQPDGMLTAGGVFRTAGGTVVFDPHYVWPYYVGGVPREHIARFKPDWSLADPDQFDPSLVIRGDVTALALQHDWKLWAAGAFFWIDINEAAMDPTLYRLDTAGAREVPFYENVKTLMAGRDGFVTAVALIPKGSDHQGMAYVAGDFIGDVVHPELARYHLFRMKANGELDPSFDTGNIMDGRYGIYPGWFDGSRGGYFGKVAALALQPDGKIVAAINGPSTPGGMYVDRGVVVRFLESGLPDPGFTPMYLDEDDIYTANNIYTVALQRDGKILVGGDFRHPVQRDDGTTYRQSLIRLNADGTLDNSLNLEFRYYEYDWCRSLDGSVLDGQYSVHYDQYGEPICQFDAGVQGLALQGDGSMVINGSFTSLRDRQGRVERDSVAKIAPDGTVDRTFDLGPIDSSRPFYKVYSNLVQPDGKIVIAGEFYGMNNKADPRHNLARFNNNKEALQSLTISSDGSRISWLRGGSAPELDRVVFEDFDGTQWNYLGKGTPIDGGWGMTVQNPVRRQTRYLRGTGYAVTSGRASLPVEEVRQYYLKPVVTVQPRAVSRSYGAANPPLEVDYLGMDQGDTPANSLTGAPLLSTTADKTSPVGSYPITASLGTLASAKYTFVMADGALLTVTKAPIDVTAVGGSREYGAADPTGWTHDPLYNGDSIASVTLTSTATERSAVGGGYLIIPSAAVFSAGSSSNYEITYKTGALTIAPRPLTVKAEDKNMLVGDPVPSFTAKYDGFTPWDGPQVISGTPAFSCDPAAGSVLADYAITVARGTLSAANYDLSFFPGTLHVTRLKDQTITLEPRPRTYGDADFDPGTATSLLPLSYQSENEAVAEVVHDSLARDRIRVKAPGVSPKVTDITASQGGNWEWNPAQSVTRPLTVNPPPGYGVNFDGVDDVITVPDRDQLDFTPLKSFTVEVWLHLSGNQPDGTGILSKGGGGAAGYRLLLNQDRIAASIGDGSGLPEVTVSGRSSLADDLWHHVALVVDRVGGVAHLYLDGHQEGDSPLNGVGEVANASPLVVGADPGGTLHFKGDLDELRLWEGARTGEEIRSAASQIIDPAAEGGLVAYYHLDEGYLKPSSAPDRTSYGNDASLSGFALSGTASTWVTSKAFVPLLETAPISSRPPGGVVAGGIVYRNYYPTLDRGLCWGTTANPSYGALNCVSAGAGEGEGEEESFVAAVSGLDPGGSYHLRAYARNLQGYSYGSDIDFKAGKLDQAITLAPVTTTYGATDFPAGATSDSPLTLNYRIPDGTVATVNGDRIHVVGAGTTTITAWQEEDATHNPAQVTRELKVNAAPLTVSAMNASRPYKSPNPTFSAVYSGFLFSDGPSSISGQPAFSSTAQWDSNTGNYPITVAIGNLTSRNYRFADFLNGILTITRSGQCITFPPIGERTYGDVFTVTAATCSGLPVTFVSSNDSIVRVEGSSLVAVGTGTVTITAREAGDGNFTGADPVSQSVTVHKAGQQVEFSSLAQKVVGDPPFELQASASSHLPVSYLSSDPLVAQVQGSTVTIVGAGTTVITASQGGNTNYDQATAVFQTLTVAQEGTPPLVALSTLSSGASTANPVLNIQGTCSDPSGIAGVTVNGVPLSGDLRSFSAPFRLSAGTNSVTLSAVDQSGNRTTESRTVVLQGSGPALAVTAPADNSVSADSQSVVQGTAQGGSSVKMSVNGSPPQGLALVNGAFSATAILAQGVNTIEVSAEASGAKSMLKRSVTLAPGKAAVAIVSPGQDMVTEAERVVVRGSAAGAAQLSLRVEGLTYSPPLTAGGFEQEVPLPAPGIYRMSAVATAADGTSSVAYRNVIRASVIRGDLDGDGMVDIGDARQALLMSLGMEAVTAAALAHADVAPLVDGVPRPDGVVDVGDVLALLRKLVGLVDF